LILTLYIHCMVDLQYLKFDIVCLPHARAVEAQKARNTHSTTEVQMFIARCWVMYATVERVAVPCPASLCLTRCYAM
jgi:hypothetical protein